MNKELREKITKLIESKVTRDYDGYPVNVSDFGLADELADRIFALIIDNYEKALEEMVWQFADRSVNDKNQPILWTGGLSALEEAFDVLGWDDPKVFGDMDGVTSVASMILKVAQIG